MVQLTVPYFLQFFRCKDSNIRSRATCTKPATTEIIVTNVQKFLKRPTNVLGCMDVSLLHMERIKLLP